MTDKEKQFIDQSSYETLLAGWRFASIGSPMFQGDTGAYYQKVMAEKKRALPDKGVGASKRLERG